MKTKTAIEVEKAIAVIFNLEGFPKRVPTDNGKEFINALLINYLAKYNISFGRGRPRHPHNQGRAERVNQTLVRKLYSYLEGDSAKKWIYIQPEITLKNNTC